MNLNFQTEERNFKRQKRNHRRDVFLRAAKKFHRKFSHCCWGAGDSLVRHASLSWVLRNERELWQIGVQNYGFLQVDSCLQKALYVKNCYSWHPGIRHALIHIFPSKGLGTHSQLLRKNSGNASKVRKKPQNQTPKKAESTHTHTHPSHFSPHYCLNTCDKSASWEAAR